MPAQPVNSIIHVRLPSHVFEDALLRHDCGLWPSSPPPSPDTHALVHVLACILGVIACLIACIAAM